MISVSAFNYSNAQCDTTYLSSDFTQSSDIIMSGVYYVDGDFILPAGITIYINEHSFDGYWIT
ncbi:MAG: hypothetical protein IPO32_06950 [Crocinitomicaceae bacterium]|nr:hypothetical protein [Crocinitomicaceae bacterium]